MKWAMFKAPLHQSVESGSDLLFPLFALLDPIPGILESLGEKIPESG
ncbi:hypothetical protein [Paenibacillus sp. FSL H7-0331]|nr:hypothetical protein [Paenibacillus sp. FSL H7-0331]